MSITLPQDATYVCTFFRAGSGNDCRRVVTRGLSFADYSTLLEAQERHHELMQGLMFMRSLCTEHLDEMEAIVAQLLKGVAK